MWIKRFLCAVIVGLGMISGVTHGDDTELYVFESSARSGARPQVLIIFDNSGSMDTSEYTETFYDRGETVNDSTKLYYSKGGVGVPEVDSNNYILQSVNGCKTSKVYLESYGFFTGFIREYGFTGENGTWTELPDELGSIVSHVDCFEDFEDAAALQFSNATGIFDGFPVDSLGSKSSPIPYTNVTSSSSSSDKTAALDKAFLTKFGIGKSVTFYTQTYIDWYHSTKSKRWTTRMEIAKRVMEDTVVTTPSVDFGLSVFNYNTGRTSDGGRIISGIQRRNAASKKTLVETINNLDADTWTPLCETLYEAYRYFSGGKVKFAKEAGSLNPERDRSVEDGNYYISPFGETQCSNRSYVVYVTDGSPTRDSAANSLVKNMSGYRSADREDGSYLPALASILNRKDVNTNLEGDQFVSTFTIGFSDGADDAAPILKKTADLGGGAYFAAKDATQLQSALSQVFSQILEVNASFTSPSIASNNFDRTQTFDSVYYAMFLPNKGPRWMGNIKKFRVTGSGDIVDKNGALAIGTDGNLKASSCSYWTPNSVCSGSSGGGDGNDVRVGGAAHTLRGAAVRTLYGNLGTGGSLKSLTKSNASSAAGGDSALAAYMGVNSTELNKLFDWAKGKDVDDDDNDNSTSDIRDDVLGDPLHSKPLAINFGSSSSPDLRILVGTNHGFLHMFKDSGDSVAESWAFMPYELLPNLVELRANVPTGVHSVYGMDSPPVAYVKTGSGGIEKAWVFTGMRRGGKSYYAIDITSPDSPSYMWKIDSDSAGMSELGQTWSEPVITLIPGWPIGNTDPETASPVLIFGAGYSPSSKDPAAVGLPDAQGRGVFIVDAKTGVLVHAFGPTSDTKMTQMPGISDSIPNSVAVLDANGDRLTDRIYATDTGGNVWRMDLPSGSPKDSTNPWTVFKFADLGGGTLASDRRFFSEPAVAQTVFTNLSEVDVTIGETTTKTKTYQNVAYDAVVVGTGHRPHPTDTSRSDMFYMLQDRHVISRSFNGAPGNEVPETLTLANLYNVTSAAPSSDADNISFGLKRGWYYGFGGVGEKSLAGASIIEGRVFFTSYVPGDTASSTQCLVSGVGRLYGFDLHKGTRSYTHEYLEMGERVPDTPQLVIPPNGNGDSYMYLIGIGAAGDEMKKADGGGGGGGDGCPPGDEKCVGGGLGVNRIYYHINE
ncbi:pilus assembly protein [Shewanella sp. YLB-07]|uniref:pilus assembly protein n=1 Tax=Shewanella sp. YLB-07 TaxID=2601268 RepID=UPI00128D8081|nr:PilC/PilY family type IV pilus protein [Shewanella sp. YLB-07]MPY20993.1 rRNA (guanine-N1)-methyltransferase [Shewanella sp. YLB-07]MPY21780.1 rRNA (guanine-N1)-methyltransferase [Shewanella sp. YLB-07]